MTTSRRKLTPEYEHDLARDPRLGYEPVQADEFVRCVEHGSPTPLERWHFHDEYELQLIVGARGQAFVGDYVGNFEAGHLVLTGPRLPHNWVSANLPPDGLQVRSLVIQFRQILLDEAMQKVRVLEEARPLLERALRGVEFFGISETVQEFYQRIKACRGLARFAEFVGLLSVLVHCQDYRVLSSAPVPTLAEHARRTPIAKSIDYINENFGEALCIADGAANAGMSVSSFSRLFSKETGYSFTDFINRVRVSKECELLMNGDDQVASICYAVGFNNVANFNRRFREIKDVTPSEFRKRAMHRLTNSQ